nr:polysaccharide deacetylase family protein [Nocardia transvalensis]
MVVSIHDVAPATTAETERWCADADAFGIPVSLLVIPGPWRGASLAATPEYGGFLRARRAHGDEIVLHGWDHRAPREGALPRRAVAQLVARGAAEFAALDTARARERLRLGIAVLSDLDLTTTGFTPPGWLASPDAERALARAGFTHTTDHFGVRDLRSGRRVRGFALSQRPGGQGERTAAWLMRTLARRTAARGGFVRIALHPDDLHRPGLRDAALRAIDAALAAGARATTYAEVIG